MPIIASISWVRKSRYWGEMLLSPIHCCDATKPPYLLSGELCTSPFHSNRLYVYTVCCRRGGQCFSVLSTRHTDVVGDSSGRSYVTEQGHNVPLLRTRALYTGPCKNVASQTVVFIPKEFLFASSGKTDCHARLWYIISTHSSCFQNKTKSRMTFV